MVFQLMSGPITRLNASLEGRYGIEREPGQLELHREPEPKPTVTLWG